MSALAMFVPFLPYAAIIVLGAVTLARDFRAAPKIPHPAAATGPLSRLAAWNAGRITADDLAATQQRSAA